VITLRVGSVFFESILNNWVLYFRFKKQAFSLLANQGSLLYLRGSLHSLNKE
jgi:hypothetical protein